VKHIYYPIYLAWIALAVAFNMMARGRLSCRTRAGGNLLWGAGAAAFMILASEPLDWFYEFRIAYWHAARVMFSNPAAMYGQGTFAFVNLPILALPFYPFASMGQYQAGAIFMVLSVALSMVAWRQLVLLGKLDAAGRWLLAGLFVINGPLFYCLRQGNSTILVLPLLAAALAALQDARPYRAGMLLAAAALIKPPLLLLPAYYALRCRWRVAAGSAIVGLTVATGSLLLFGLEVHRAWYECCVTPFVGRALASYTSQSLSSFLARWFCELDSGEVWWPIPVDGRFQLLHRLVVVGLGGVTLLLCLRRAAREQAAAGRLDFCLVLCLALVISPVCWTHYYLLLLLPAALLLGGQGGSPLSKPQWVSLSLAFLAMSLPVRGWSVNHWGLSLLVSHYLSGALLLLVVLAMARHQLTRSTRTISSGCMDAAPREQAA
jgi:hypothetical protein